MSEVASAVAEQSEEADNSGAAAVTASAAFTCITGTGTATAPAAQKVQGKVFALTSEEAAASPSTVTCNLSVCGFTAFALIDSGCTHSIISMSFASRLHFVPRRTDCEYVISSPGGPTLFSHSRLLGCDIRVGDRVLPANLIVLDIHDFDVILGMDWLEENFANIDCRTKVVTFSIPGSPPFQFHGDKLVRVYL